MSNSALVNYARMSPCNSGRRTQPISKITVHHMAGNLTVEQCGAVFAPASRGASANYGIGTDGRVGLYVDEANRSWASSSAWNDNRAVTIEVANSSVGGDWPVSDAAWAKLVELCADICRRNGIRALTWTGDRNGSLTCHYMFKATACPGPYLKARMAQLASEVNARLSGGSVSPAPAPQQPAQKPAQASPATVHVHYALRRLNGPWLPEVTDFGEGDQGYAGDPNRQHDLVYMYPDEGTLRYRAHVLGGGWLPYVTKGDPRDTVNACAGIPGRALDGIEAYYVTPDGREYKQAWYRSQTTKRAGWLPVCCDDGSTFKQYDGFCGILGEPLDRFQLAVADKNPF